MISISGNTIKTIIKESLLHEHVDPQVAEYVAEGLVSTSLRGVNSHGIRLIHHYLAALKAGRVNPKPSYKIEKRLPTVAILDADDTFGHAAGMEAAKLAIEMANEYGSGNVAVKNSTHYGAAAYFALEIAANDMIGTSYTHADSLIIPTNSKRSFLGNNPVCFAAPVAGEGPFCLDMATSLITFNEVRRLREINGTTPKGVGADKDGNPTTNPHEITMLLPVGGHKGYGLSLMVEILCSTLTGMPFGPHISKMFVNLEKKRHLGHFVSAMSIEGFGEAGAFKLRLRQMLDELRAEPPLDQETPVMVAGDPEKKSFA
ncbi:MAG: Ldh family oxidoreductase, partial [Desulfobulbaceae bacterium]|nr:Ldh family oxidoreductase [Desulfobulbaceae bacterium]